MTATKADPAGGVSAAEGAAPLTEAEQKALEQEFDSEVRFRPLAAPVAIVSSVALFLLACFHYYTAGFGILQQTTHRGIHLAFTLGLVFAVFSFSGRVQDEPGRSSLLAPLGLPLLDWAFMIGGVVSAMYVPWVFDTLAMRVGNPNPIDVAMGTILIVMLLEATRRAMGWPLPVIAICFMAYAYFGQSMPGILIHPGASWTSLVNHLYLTSQGIYGTALGVIATYVFHFVLFGVLATRIGLGQLFIDLASALAGRYAGGPAKVSVLSSALLGSISGSIDRQHRHHRLADHPGDDPHRLPAALRRRGGGRVLHRRADHAAGHGRGRLPDDRVSRGAADHDPDGGAGARVHALLRRADAGPHGGQASRAARADEGGAAGHLEGVPRELDDGHPARGSGGDPAVGAHALLRRLLGHHRLHRRHDGAEPPVGGLGAAVRGTAKDVWDGFILGAKYSLSVTAAAALVGIVIGVVTLTGVGFKIVYLVTSTAGGWAEGAAAILPFEIMSVQTLTLLFTLMMTAVVCILMGCGIPTTANYLIMIAIAAPILSSLGVEPLVAHFFVFYYGVLADVTPPVALAAYAAAGIAGSNAFKTGNTAFRLSMGKALVPFVFVFSPSLLLVTQGFTWPLFFLALSGAMLGITALSAAFSGYLTQPLRPWERALLAVAALLFVAPDLTTTLIAAAICLPVVVRGVIGRGGAATAG